MVCFRRAGKVGFQEIVLLQIAAPAAMQGGSNIVGDYLVGQRQASGEGQWP